MEHESQPSARARRTRESADRTLFGATLVFCILNALFYAGWVAVDLPARAFGSRESWLGMDWRAYMDGSVVLAGWPLYLETICVLATVVGVLKRRIWALPVAIVGLASGTFQWAHDTGNPYFGTGLAEAYVFAHAAVFLISIGLITLIWQRRLLR